jgi:hypothetical protein
MIDRRTGVSIQEGLVEPDTALALRIQGIFLDTLSALT